MGLITDFNHVPDEFLKYFNAITPNSEIDCFNLQGDDLHLKNKAGCVCSYSFHEIKIVTGCETPEDNLELGGYKWALPSSEDRPPLFLAKGDELIIIPPRFFGAD